MQVAAQPNNSSLIEALIAAGADVNAQDKYGATALMCASHAGKLGNVKALLGSSNIDLKVQNRGGYTALMLAKHYHYDNIVELLKQAGADE
jgi:ankyrin repeat protein